MIIAHVLKILPNSRTHHLRGNQNYFRTTQQNFYKNISSDNVTHSGHSLSLLSCGRLEIIFLGVQSL